ncbi:protein FAM177B [Mastomys coucha]|uniref:protein FAM177B n=1 Tax=Mastomys coucha TaxID=35658 RepID=UPI00126248FB|nr:protein FAM177B [Mastomys coucha]
MGVILLVWGRISSFQLSNSISTCELQGGRFAAFFGLTEPKHQHVLNADHRTQTKDGDTEIEGGDSKAQGTEVPITKGVTWELATKSMGPSLPPESSS